jgi:hypothetical protein
VTPAAPPAPHTALAVLFGPDASAEDALEHQIASDSGSISRALRGVPRATRTAAIRQAAVAAAGLLDVDLIDILAAGWRKYEELVAAARRTLAAPGSTEVVQLASHRVTGSQQPFVTVSLDGRDVATLNLGLSVVLNVHALLADVSAGRLTAVHSGRCDITATLAIAEADVVTREAHIELPGVVALQHGIGLLPAGEYSRGTDAEGGDHDPHGTTTAVPAG